MILLNYLFILFFSLGQLERLSFLNQSINIYIHEIIIFLILLLNFKKLKFKKNKLNLSLLLLNIIFTLSLLPNIAKYNQIQNLIAFGYLLRFYLYSFFFIYLNTVDKNIIKKSLRLFSCLVLFYSFAQYFFYPNLRNLYYLGWDPHWYRMFGLFFDTSITGIILVFIFFFQIFYPYKDKYLNWLLRLITFIAILLTFSRITFLVFIISLICWYLANKNYKNILIFLIVFLIGIFIVPKPTGESVNLTRTFSIESRIADNLQGLNIFFKNPILGVGYNRIGYFKNSRSIHSKNAFASSFMTILVSSGIIGIIFFINFLFQSFIAINHKGKIILLALFLSALFDNTILNSFGFVILFTIIALFKD